MNCNELAGCAEATENELGGEAWRDGDDAR